MCAVGISLSLAEYFSKQSPLYLPFGCHHCHSSPCHYVKEWQQQQPGWKSKSWHRSASSNQAGLLDSFAVILWILIPGLASQRANNPPKQVPSNAILQGLHYCILSLALPKTIVFCMIPQVYQMFVTGKNRCALAGNKAVKSRSCWPENQNNRQKHF